jgi:hypothetical protein
VRRHATRRALSILALSLSACSDEAETLEAGVVFSPGKEADAFTRDPKPERIVITSRTGDGAERTLADAPWPEGSIALGELSEATPYAFRVEGRDAAGRVVIRGGTPFVSSDALVGDELTILCSRVAEGARPGSELSTGVARPVGALLFGRYAFLADAAPGSPVPAELYDFLALAPLSNGQALPRVARSLASGDGETVLLVDETGATALDVAQGTAAEVALPFEASELAGAPAVQGEDGAYLVVPSRLDRESTSILRVGSDGVLTGLSLPEPRRAAASVWIAGAGLAVLGGGPSTVDTFAAGSTVAGTLEVGLPPVHGGAAVSARVGEILFGGGTEGGGAPSPLRKLTLSCATGCPRVDDVADALPFGNTGDVSAYPMSAGSALFVGKSADGTTVAELVSDDGFTVTVAPVPLRSARRGAFGLALGDGFVALFGGVDPDGNAVASLEVIAPP